MNIITKTFALATTLTLAMGSLTACNSEFIADELEVDAPSLRNGGGSSGNGGIVFNTPAFGEMTGAELVLGAASPDDVVLDAVIVTVGDGETAQHFELSSLFSESGELMALGATTASVSRTATTPTSTSPAPTSRAPSGTSPPTASPTPTRSRP